MKEPFFALGTFTALVAATGTTSDPALADRIGAVLSAGACSVLYSWWKSRSRKADSTDTAIWAMIALCGSMSFGWFLGPVVADRPILGLSLPSVGLTTWLLTISGSPAIEWLLDGRGFKFALKKFGMQPEETP